MQTIKIGLIRKDSKLSKEGQGALILRVRLKRVKMEFNTGRATRKENWSPEIEKVIPDNKGNKEVNAYLESFKNRIFMAYSSLLSTGQEIRAEKLKQAVYGGQVKRKHSLIDSPEKHVSTR